MPLNRIVNQETAKRILVSSLNRGKLASTYLFYGEDGVGKWATAIDLAALINCEQPQKDDEGLRVDYCGKCVNCHQIKNLSFPELFFAVPLPPHRSSANAIELTNEILDLKREEPYSLILSKRQMTIPIETARDIRRKTSIKPAKGITRVVIFYQMERMLQASADSLLKLIEEPPPETVILLTARDPENLLPTIRSRAQKIRFKPLNTANIIEYIKENYEISHEKAEIAARLSNGSIGRAIQFIEDDNQSSVRQESLLMFKTILGRDNVSAVSIVNELISPNDRGGLEIILGWWQSFLSDIILLKYAKGETVIINDDLKSELEKLGNRIDGVMGIKKMVEEIKQISEGLRRNIHIRPAVSSLALNLRRGLLQSS